MHDQKSDTISIPLAKTLPSLAQERDMQQGILGKGDPTCLQTQLAGCEGHEQEHCCLLDTCRLQCP